MHFVIHAVDRTDALPTRAKFYRAHRIHLDQAGEHGIHVDNHFRIHHADLAGAQVQQGQAAGPAAEGVFRVLAAGHAVDGDDLWSADLLREESADEAAERHPAAERDHVNAHHAAAHVVGGDELHE